MKRTYSELIQLHTLEERFEYLSLRGAIGEPTFGSDRWINQQFYRSREWRILRHEVIARDLGCEMGLEDWPIRGAPYIHHMNPLTMSDIVDSTENLLAPEYLITVSHRTHNAIHYGDKDLLPRGFVERTPHDTAPWRLGAS